MNYYPVLLDLENRPVAVVGGGAVAHEKVLGLLAAKANVTVFSDSLSEPLEGLQASGSISVVRRAPSSDDLAAAALVVAERRTAEENRELFEAADREGRFVNVQDDVPHCSFIAPAVVRQGDLVMTISTSGAAPALAVRLRQFLSPQLGPEYARFLDLARRYRRPLASEVPGFSERRRRWYDLVDSTVWTQLRASDEAAAERIATKILGVDPDV